ncbi:helicase-associated domain-containing protein [Paenibacillus lautus]|uniref:helicase-associated domain-containing protein n=1 Tax=Paenibacillus lautus TaxID=1401 RepID=UPI002FBE8F6B
MTRQQGMADTMSLGRLLPKERSVLHHIWRRFAGQGFDDDKLRSLRFPRLSGVEAQLAFVSLRQQGWVRAVKRGWGERLYFIPFDKLQILQEGFGPVEAFETVPISSASVRLQQEARSGIAIDMFNVLVYMAKNRVSLTAKGILHKKCIQKLGGEIALTPYDVEGLALHYDHAEAYPPHVAMVLDLLFAFGLVVAEQGELKLNRAALRHWLMLSREAMERDVLLHMMESYIPNSAEFQHWTWRICHSSLSGGVWYRARQMPAAVSEPLEGAASTGKELLPEEASSWLRLLTGCGYTDSGIDDDGQFLFRWRVAPSSLLNGGTGAGIGSSGLFIQPDFEILIPPDVPNSVKFQAACCTERVSDDVMTVYRLTRDSVMQAAKAGVEPEGIAAFLTKHAAAGMPENVHAALFQWGKEMDRAGLNEPLRYAEAPPEEGAELAGPDGDDHYPMQWGNRSRPSCGLIRPARGELALEPDDTLPDPLSIIPDLSRIPVMWTRDWRSYHGSTSKQMMEQALELSAKLEIAVDGSRMEFIPFQILRQPWKISGALYDPDSDKTGAVVELGEGEWREMRLVIP